jgi:hypothetical protein
MSNAGKILTSPADPKYPGSFDNVKDDLIVSEDDILTSSIGIQYVYVLWSIHLTLWSVNVFRPLLLYVLRILQVPGAW